MLSTKENVKYKNEKYINISILSSDDYLPENMENKTFLVKNSKNYKIMTNEQKINQINDKISFYQRKNLENIWQEIYLKARMFNLIDKMPEKFLDKKLILKSEINKLYEILKTSKFYI